MQIIVEKSWEDFIATQKTKPYFLELQTILSKEDANFTIYPKPSERFLALQLTPLDTLKVVILGQDPYHGADQAHGLAFSIASNQKIPPTLRNIFQELQDDLDITKPKTSNLYTWSQQGVLLLNTILSVRANQPKSHQNIGWENFTDALIQHINKSCQGIVFILWGAQAAAKKQFINTNCHYIIESPHPSPLSAYRGFFKTKPFSKTNQLLIQQNKTPINWVL